MLVNRGQCQATSSNGQPCKARARDNGWCIFHDPALAEQRSNAARKGGHNKSKTARLEKLVPTKLIPVWEELSQALVEVHSGEIQPQVGSAMASLSGALVKVL